MRTYSNFVPRILKHKHKNVKSNNVSTEDIMVSETVDHSYVPDDVVKSYKQYHKSLSEEELQLVIKLYSEGSSTYQLASQFGCHRTTIGLALNRSGIQVTHEASKKEALTKQVLKMYADYQKPEDIGKSLGIHATTVRKILHANNVDVRKSWEYTREK